MRRSASFSRPLLLVTLLSIPSVWSEEKPRVEFQAAVEALQRDEIRKAVLAWGTQLYLHDPGENAYQAAPHTFQRAKLPEAIESLVKPEAVPILRH